jgi:hypothetical protein
MRMVPTSRVRFFCKSLAFHIVSCHVAQCGHRPRPLSQPFFIAVLESFSTISTTYDDVPVMGISCGCSECTTQNIYTYPSLAEQ